VEQALIRLREFSRKHIYDNPKLTTERAKIRAMYGTMFSSFLEDLADGKRSSALFSDFIDTDWINPRYKESATGAELVRDYIAGMTDRYFAKRFEEIVIPRKVEGKFS